MARAGPRPVVRLKSVVHNATGDKIIWSVLWVTKKGRIKEHWCDNDLVEALRVYQERQGAKMLTLRSCNVGFPPPESWRATKLVNAGSKKEPRWINVKFKMLAANRKGIWWCPYCREFRRFEKWGHFTYEGLKVTAEGMYCPICGISHRDYHVRRWNPHAALLYNTTRRKSGSRKARARR